MAFSLSSNSHTSKSGCEMFLETVVAFLIKKIVICNWFIPGNDKVVRFCRKLSFVLSL